MTTSDIAPDTEPSNHGKRIALRTRAIVDLIALGFIAAAILVVCYLCDGWERFFALVSQISAWDGLHIHEVLILALLSPLLAAIYSYRRMRELDALLRDQESYVKSLEWAQQNVSACSVKLHEQTFLDELTKLANRNALVDHIESLLAQQASDGEIRAIAYFGIDNFKRVNGHFGYATGDMLLRAVAERLTVRLREENTFIARPGGDLFVVVLDGLKHSFNAEVVTARSTLR